MRAGQVRRAAADAVRALPGAKPPGRPTAQGLRGYRRRLLAPLQWMLLHSFESVRKCLPAPQIVQVYSFDVVFRTTVYVFLSSIGKGWHSPFLLRRQAVTKPKHHRAVCRAADLRWRPRGRSGRKCRMNTVTLARNVA